MALIWAAVFLILCKGLKSLGKLTYLINTLPLLALIAVTGKFVSVVDPASLQVRLPDSSYIPSSISPLFLLLSERVCSQRL